LKDNPTLIILGVVATVLTISFALFEKLILQPSLKEKDIQIAEQTKQLASIPALEKSLTEAKQAASKKDDEIKQLKLRNQELSKENVFSTEDVYPKGYRSVRIGDPIAKVNEAYAGKTITDEDGWFSVKTDDSMFPQIDYCYDRNAKRGRIVTYIIFHIGGSDIQELLRRQLAEKYGSARLIETRKRFWELSNVFGYDLELTPVTYTIDRHSNARELIREMTSGAGAGRQ
jgi:hypothetical protein